MDLPSTPAPQARSRADVLTLAAVIVLTVLGPFLGYLALRLNRKSPSITRMLGLPWPAPWQDVGSLVCVAILVATVVLAVMAITRGGALRTAGITCLVVLSVSALPVYLVFAFSFFGDASPDSLREWQRYYPND